MKSKPLFGEADAGAIKSAISDPRFQMAAMVRVGRRDVWEAALVEVRELYQRHLLDEMGGATPALSMDEIYELILLLAKRTVVFADRNLCCNMMMHAFTGMPLPLATRMFESPEEERQRLNKAWLANYHATKNFKRKAREK